MMIKSFMSTLFTILFLGLFLATIDFVLIKKTRQVLLENKEKARTLIDNITTGLIAGIWLITLQKGVSAIERMPAISFQSFLTFVKSVGVILINLFIITTCTLAVIFLANYILLKGALEKNKKSKKK